MNHRVIEIGFSLRQKIAWHVDGCGCRSRVPGPAELALGASATSASDRAAGRKQGTPRGPDEGAEDTKGKRTARRRSRDPVRRGKLQGSDTWPRSRLWRVLALTHFRAKG